MGALPQGGRGLVFAGVLIIHIVLSGLFAGVGGAFWSRDQPSKEELEETEGREAPCSQQGSSSETEGLREGAGRRKEEGAKATDPGHPPALLGQGWSGEGCGSTRLMEGLGGWQRGRPCHPPLRPGRAWLLAFLADTLGGHVHGLSPGRVMRPRSTLKALRSSAETPPPLALLHLLLPPLP